MEVKARVVKMAREAKEASRGLSGLSAKIKDEALLRSPAQMTLNR